MSEEVGTKVKLDEDLRPPCRYGAKCYQKNELHHMKYKHPSKRIGENQNEDCNSNKKKKLDETVSTDPDNEAKNVVKISNDVSDSDDETSINGKHDDQENQGCETSSGVDDSTVDTDNVKMNASQEKEKFGENISNESKEDDLKLDIDKELLADPKQFIKNKFLVEMPDDFYKFWELCKHMNQKNPTKAFSLAGLTLVGPYDVLNGKMNNKPNTVTDETFLLHWRYFYDPPELQTVVKGDDKTGFHIGYFRDSPNEPPVFMVSNCGLVDGTLTKMGENIFAAMYMYIQEHVRKASPFIKMQVIKLGASIKRRADELGISLDKNSKKMQEREKKVVTQTFNKVGLVVPYNKKSQLGYRELAMPDKKLHLLLTQIQKADPEQQAKFLSDLQPVLTFASIAADECDFGTGIELGWNIISHGVDSLNNTVANFLSSNYSLLNREAFAKIAHVHMANRKKSTNLSIL